LGALAKPFSVASKRSSESSVSASLAACRNFSTWDFFFAMGSKPPTEEQMKDRILFYSTVGQGISNWARMEGQLIHFAADLLDTNVEKAGVVFYSIINFYVWLSIIDDLLLLDKQLTNVKKLWTPISSRLKALNDTRVRLAHHTAWHTDHSLTAMALRPAKEDRRSRSKGYSNLMAPEIIKFTQVTTELVHELTDLRIRLRSARIAL
jgi:hypothetical protein